MAEIDGAVADFVRPRRIVELFSIGSFGPRPTSLFALHKVIDEIVADDRIAGLVLVLKGFRGGMAKATALRAALMRLRAAKREVVVVLPTGGGTKEMVV